MMYYYGLYIPGSIWIFFLSIEERKIGLWQDATLNQPKDQQPGRHTLTLISLRYYDCRYDGWDRDNSIHQV